jgi:hypothetical protein
MEHNNKVKAIQFIRPNSEFILNGDKLEWLDENVNQPTKVEIDAGWVAYQAAQESEANAKAEAKAAAQFKLAALGLTVEDLQALGL